MRVRQSLFLTVPPAVEFGLQPLDDGLQTLVLVLLLLILLLPLLGRQLQVHRHRVLDGLGSETDVEKTFHSYISGNVTTVLI